MAMMTITSGDDGTTATFIAATQSLQDRANDKQGCAGEECGGKDGKGNGESLFAIVIAPRTGGGTTTTSNAAHTTMDR